MSIGTGVTDQKTKSKEERIRDFVKAVNAVESAIQPYKEQLSDLKKNYILNGWLSKTEMKNVGRALRLLKDETNMGELEEMYNKIKG